MKPHRREAVSCQILETQIPLFISQFSVSQPPLVSSVESYQSCDVVLAHQRGRAQIVGEVELTTCLFCRYVVETSLREEYPVSFTRQNFNLISDSTSLDLEERDRGSIVELCTETRFRESCKLQPQDSLRSSFDGRPTQTRTTKKPHIDTYHHRRIQSTTPETFAL